MIEFDHVSFSYAMENKKVLKNISWQLPMHKITVLCGQSGCGKTTLLRLIKDEIRPAGQLQGNIHTGISSQNIAMVFQNPDAQLVCGSVIQDLVFQMENLGMDPLKMKKHLAETVCFFGIESLLHRSPESLSGGQKQLIALCSAMMTYPKLLILDEPLSQLDPIAQLEFLQTLRRINEEFGVTIFMSEHRLNDVLAFADEIAVMKQGTIVQSGDAKEVLQKIYLGGDAELMPFIPDIAKASMALYQKVCITPRELKEKITSIDYHADQQECEKTHPAVLCKNIVYTYPDGEDYVLKRLTTSFLSDKITCLFGGNGSGKSTLLKIIAGIITHYSGQIKMKKMRIGYMPQNIQAYFLHDKVKDEIWFEGCDEAYFQKLTQDLSIEALLSCHPYDISSGEASRVVLASLLLKKPSLLLLDEPTKGLDYGSKEKVAALLKKETTTVLMATHDLDFAARFADQCAMLFDGDIAFSDTPHRFFKENHYYTTSLHKAFHYACEDIITFEDVLRL